jgi:hypothetical protein
MIKIVAINYFEQRVDREGLEVYKASEAYAKDLELAEGDWAFAQLQDRVEECFTTVAPVAESTDDDSWVELEETSVMGDYYYDWVYHERPRL